MKKRILIIVAAAVLLTVLALTACGGTYTCYDCGKTTGKAYYDMMANEDYVLCEDCARSYWMPLPYENYRVR